MNREMSHVDSINLHKALAKKKKSFLLMIPNGYCMKKKIKQNSL